MTRIIVPSSKRVVPSLYAMGQLALKRIFESDKMSNEDNRRLDYGIESWVNKIDMTKAEKKQLQLVVDSLVNDEMGRYDKIKHNLKRADLHYTQLFPDGLE